MVETSDSTALLKEINPLEAAEEDLEEEEEEEAEEDLEEEIEEEEDSEDPTITLEIKETHLLT